jgi:hypothetical protein
MTGGSGKRHPGISKFNSRVGPCSLLGDRGGRLRGGTLQEGLLDHAGQGGMLDSVGLTHSAAGRGSALNTEAQRHTRGLYFR